MSSFGTSSSLHLQLPSRTSTSRQFGPSIAGRWTRRMVSLPSPATSAASSPSISTNAPALSGWAPASMYRRAGTRSRSSSLGAFDGAAGLKIPRRPPVKLFVQYALASITLMLLVFILLSSGTAQSRQAVSSSDAFRTGSRWNVVQRLLPDTQRNHQPGTGARFGVSDIRDPFSSYNCLGDDYVAAGEVYAPPFRFHVYNDMPKELLQDVMERAQKYWLPDHSNNQFLGEVALATDLPLHPCHTNDPAKADAFIVPVQTVSMIWLEKEDGRNDGGRTAFAKVMEWLENKPSFKQFRGRDHYAMAIPWNIRRRPFEGLNLLGPEVPVGYIENETFTMLHMLHGFRDIVIPYPDPDSIKHYTPEHLAEEKKENLAVFVGTGVIETRRIIHDQMIEYNKKKRPDQGPAIWQIIDHANGTHAARDLLPSAIFGPVMSGDSFSSRRLFSLLFAGTIPVIIADKLMLPFENLLNYDSFCVFMNEKDVLESPEVNIFELLAKIPKEEVARLQENGRRVKRHFIYNQGKPQPGDALDMFVSSNPANS